MGTRLVINGSKVESQQPDVCTPGCNFMVKNLFYNTPGRRRFLKSDSVELGALMREFERLALVNNHIRFTLDTGHRKIDLRPAGFKQRIGDLWKNNLNMQLLPIEIETSLVKISGFVSRPEFARRRNPLQYLIVNGRNMRHPCFHKAIVSCYDGIIAQDTQPCYFLKFEVDPQTIDVNIHPTKNEIKFEHELEMRPILTAAVRAAIGKFAAAPSIDFTQDIMPLSPAREGDVVHAPSSVSTRATIHLRYRLFPADRVLQADRRPIVIIRLTGKVSIPVLCQTRLARKTRRCFLSKSLRCLSRARG